LLLLVDTDKEGKVSKQEWMKFMEAEYLDVKELMQSKLRVSEFSSVGK
jgi:hypothetical protein